MALRQNVDIEKLEAFRSFLADNPDKASEYRSGRQALMGFFMGQVMAEAGTGADGGVVQRLLRERLAG